MADTLCSPMRRPFAALLALLTTLLLPAPARAQAVDAGYGRPASLEQTRQYFAARHQTLLRAKVTKTGDVYVLHQDDGGQVEVRQIGGQARRGLRQAATRGELVYVVARKIGGEVMVTYAADTLPLTDEQQREQSLQELNKAMAARVEAGTAALTEFPPAATGLVMARGGARFEGTQLVQDLPVTTGRERAAGEVPTVMGHLAAAPGKHYEAKPMALYRQVVTVNLASPEAAQRAWLHPLPLYHGHLYACANRYDDNDRENGQRVTAATATVGVYGTCFVNGIGFQTADSLADFTAADLRAILATGSSIGNHSEHHNATGRIDSLPNCEQFLEVYLPRAQREAQADCRIMTAAPPHNTFGSAQTMENWINAGNYAFAIDCPGSRGFPANNVVINRDPADLMLVASAFHARHYRNEAALALGLERWRGIGQDVRIWKTNWNRFAAYRYQYTHTAIGKEVKDCQAVFTLYRPELATLNDEVPLTIRVAGVPATAVASVAAASGPCVPLAKLPLAPQPQFYTFDLFPAEVQFLPEKIGCIICQGTGAPASDPDFPGLAATLTCDDQGLALELRNQGTVPVSDLSVTYRLPHGWEPAVVRLRVAAPLPPGTTWRDHLAPKAPADAALLQGTLLAGAQLEFRWGGQPARLHVLAMGKPNSGE